MNNPITQKKEPNHYAIKLSTNWFNAIGAGSAWALGAALTSQAAAPAAAQGAITFRTYAGDPRAAVLAGTATADGVFYPKRMEGPYNGYPGADPGDDDTLPVDVRENYVMELIGYFYPPKTGKVQFALVTDDPGTLYFSTDDNPANKKLIATEPTWNGKRNFGLETRRTRVNDGTQPADRLVNQSPWIDVVAGKPYFIQSIATEFGGGDNNAVAFRFEGDAEFADQDKPISGQYLSTFDRASLSAPYASAFFASPLELTFTVNDGEGAGAVLLDPASVKVTVDGAIVPATISKSGATSTIRATLSSSRPARLTRRNLSLPVVRSKDPLRQSITRRLRRI